MTEVVEFRGPWMATRSGGRIYPLRPDLSRFTVEDIASGLSQEARFAGQTKKFYSVAQHSVHMAQFATWKLGDMTLARYCLMHDSPEAFYKDIPKPLKSLLPRYDELEDRLMAEILFRLHMDPAFPPLLSDLDAGISADEARFWFDDDWTNEPDCMIRGTIGYTKFDSWPPSVAEIQWINCFRQLFNEHTKIQGLQLLRPRPGRDAEQRLSEGVPATPPDIHWSGGHTDAEEERE